MAIDNEIYQNFKIAFENRCFKLLTQAYQTSLTRNVIQLDWNENDISSELHEYIKVNPLRSKWKVSSNVEAHLPIAISKLKGFSATFPRIDFRLTSFMSAFEYEYFFEAKNLKERDSALKRRYIDTGIDNFTSGKYKEGSLVGYVLDGVTVNTIDGINKLLKKDSRGTERLIRKLNVLHSDYYESEHSKIGTIKHFLLNFVPI
ncbi:hypothetical protein [Chryseobacterium sp. G0201]|uniref:hypothetical protein n=1 Tax=Chryseobacterium sp. G0201 TaxID=2487065 RepID=UPI000F502846|nr:hypothetical protein [Chryseobacterium sp. G0201]AZA54594.1 hypothetical protein EG348_17130 [Chryseobacterium sp. G0201]